MPYLGARESIKNIKRNFEKNEIDLVFSKNAFVNRGNVSGTISERLEDLYKGFTNDSVDVVMSLIGGFNSNELLPEIDFDLISNSKAKFVGMSDMTTLVSNLNQKSGIQTYYGIQARHFVNDLDFSQSLSVLEERDNFAGFYRDNSEIKILRDGQMKGKLIGGNLALLCWLLGTPYFPEITDGSILFLEDDEETNSYYFQMYLNHLEQAGVFERISGLIFGDILRDTKIATGESFEKIVKGALGGYSFPIIYNADFGHIDNPITIPFGLEYELNTDSV